MWRNRMQSWNFTSFVAYRPKEGRPIREEFNRIKGFRSPFHWAKDTTYCLEVIKALLLRHI